MAKKKKGDTRHHQLYPCAIESCVKMGFRSTSSLKRTWPFKPDNSGKVCDYHYLQDYRMSKKAAQLEGTRSQKKQQLCCVSECDDPASSRTRFSLKGQYNFKPNYLTRGWNNICNYHYHSDLYKHKYNEHARSRRKRRRATRSHAYDSEDSMDDHMEEEQFAEKVHDYVSDMDVEYEDEDESSQMDTDSPYEKDSVEDEYDEEEYEDDVNPGFPAVQHGPTTFPTFTHPTQEPRRLHLPHYEPLAHLNTPHEPASKTLSILDVAEKYSSNTHNKSFMLNPKRKIMMRWLKENGLVGV